MDFDYVIVGAGAAGCALASRLSEDPTISVLLLEAGSRNWASHLGRIPRALPAVLRSGLLTSYPTLAPAGTGQRDYWVRGRGIGGSTLVNGMMYLRGEPTAYDNLADATSVAWGWSAFERAYDEIERRFIRPSSTSLTHLDQIILRSMVSAGLRAAADLNAGSGQRAGATPASIAGGLRRSAAAFLSVAPSRENLRILDATTVESVLWQGRRVTGVVARRGNERREIRAATVVLCAGTIETPLLLERSGIGEPALLRRAGLRVRVESPNVGERVREQRGQGLQVRLKNGPVDAMELSSVPAIATQATRYLTTRGGALARPAYDVAAMISSRDGTYATQHVSPQEPSRHDPSDRNSTSRDSDPVDIQVVAAPFALASGDVLRPAAYPGVVFSGYPIRPTTPSSVHIDPEHPAAPPIIDARYAQTEPDERLQAATMSALRRLAYTGALGELICDEDDAGPGMPGSSIYHAVGSAAMGRDRDEVTDPQLRVRGVRGLRIADLSVLPFHPSGGTAAPAMAIGWLAGDLLAAEHHAG